MVLSNKKRKQLLREAQTELISASEEPTPSSKPTLRTHPLLIARESAQSLLATLNQQPRLSKREKRREKSDDGGDIIEMKKEVEIKKRKRGDGEQNGGVGKDEVKRETVQKKKKKKKKKKRKLDGAMEPVVEKVMSNGFESKENLDPCTKVYVGGIPFYSSEDDIRSFFESCGTITDIDCMKFPESGKFRGIAIITFKTEAAANRALALDGSDMGGLYLKIQPYKSERVNKASPFTPAVVEGYNRIYVGNLSYEITEDDLRHLFSDCTITSIRFGKDKETGEFKCYGHVDFADSESVKTALKLDQNLVCGRPIRISCALAKKPAVTGSTPFQEKAIYSELKSEDSKPLQEITKPNQPYSDDTYEGAPVPVSSKIKRRTCYECGEKGHLSSACPKMQSTDQGNPVTISNQLKIVDSKPLQENTNTYQPYSNYTYDEVAPVPVSSKIKRRTCYECGEKGHLSSACPKMQPTNQANPVTASNQLKSEDIKPFHENRNTYQSNINDTNEAAPAPVSSKIKRRTCYECGEKGHLSSACPKMQPTNQANPVTVSNQLKSEDIKPLHENPNTYQSNINDTNEAAPAPVSSKIKRRTCYECGEKGHLSSACPQKQATA